MDAFVRRRVRLRGRRQVGKRRPAFTERAYLLSRLTATTTIAFVAALLSQTTGNLAGAQDLQPTEAEASEQFSSDVLDGIYAGLGTGLHISAMGTIDRDVSTVFVTFYPDGKVYRRVPEGGLEGWDRAAAEADTPALWGTYKKVGPDKWEILWNESTRVGIVTREGKTLTYENTTVSPVASCEGLLLHGLYVQPGALESPYPPNWLALLETGEFFDNALIGDVAYQNLAMPNPRTVESGKGQYRIGRNTLYLEYDDDRRLRVEIHTETEYLAGSELPLIFINGMPLLRVNDRGQ